MSTWIALAVVIGVFGWLAWWSLDWLPLEGMGKVLFVAGCWYGGGCFVYYGVTRQLYYWGISLVIGLGMLAWGCLLAINPFLRWRQDRLLFGKTAPVARWLEPERRQEDRAA